MGMSKEVIVFAAFPQWPSGVRGKGWNLAFKSENSGAGCSVGGIRVDTARSFRRGSHRRRSGCILPPSVSLQNETKNSLVLQQNSKASKFDYTIEVLYLDFQRKL